jgi:hypothetical protein
MRASIPAIFVLILFSARYLRQAKGLARVAFIGLLVVGAYTPSQEVYRSVTRTMRARAPSEYLADHFRTFAEMPNEKGKWLSNFIALEPQKEWFFRYLAK